MEKSIRETFIRQSLSWSWVRSNNGRHLWQRQETMRSRGLPFSRLDATDGDGNDAGTSCMGGFCREEN